MTSVLIFLGLLALTAFFNLAEMALVAARTARLNQLGRERNVNRVHELKKRPGLFLAAIRAGDLLTDLLMGAFVVTAFENVLRPLVGAIPILTKLASPLSTILVFAVVSYLVLVFADLLPKSLALNSPERLATAIAPPLQWLIRIARPCFAALEHSNSFVLRMVGIVPQNEEQVSAEEIRSVLSQGLSSGVLLGFERSMMERILDLNHRSVRTVMTGRRFVQSLSLRSNPADLRVALGAATASQLPVLFGSDLDEIAGIVRRSDALSAILHGNLFDLSSLLTKPAYVPETATVLSVLDLLKRNETKLAIVVDEYGSTLGLLTLADILEAVAGEVSVAGESNPVASKQLSAAALTPENDGTYVLSGDTPVDDLVEWLAIPVEAAGRRYKTIAGLVLDKLGRLPTAGETLPLFEWTVEILQTERATVQSVRLHPPGTNREIATLKPHS